MQLFLGGVRSGKSRLAEMAAADCGLPVTYIATARLLDDEMRARVALHRTRRSANWAVVEEPVALANALRNHARPDHCVLVDCLTLWLSNLFEASDMQAEIDALFAALPALPGEVIFVSGEVGLGVMPANALARQYADQLGELNQQIAQHCARVTLAVAGLPVAVKNTQ